VTRHQVMTVLNSMPVLIDCPVDYRVNDRPIEG